MNKILKPIEYCPIKRKQKLFKHGIEVVNYVSCVFSNSKDKSCKIKKN